LRPVHPVTLEQTAEDETLHIVIQTVTWLEGRGYVLVERKSDTKTPPS